jgi:uncharacterized phage protein gp47/JayE
LPFSRPTLQQIAARIKVDVQGALSGTAAFFRRSFERAVTGALAGASHHLHGHLAWLTLQINPRTADPDIVETVHGEPFGVFKKDAEFTKLTVSAPGANGTTVTIGTVWLRSDDVRYTTDATVVVSGGAAVLALTAEIAGDDANCEDGVVLELESPIAGMTGTATVTSTTQEGTDLETPEEYLARVIARHQTPPRGGAQGDYETWALEVAGITRAWEFPRTPKLGQVTVYVVNDDDSPITVSGGKLDEVVDYISQPGRKPSTGDVFAYTPTLAPVDFTISGIPVEVRDAVTAELAALLARVGTPAGMTIALSQIDEAISIAPGESDHELVAPVAAVAVPFGSLPVIGTITWV